MALVKLMLGSREVVVLPRLQLLCQSQGKVTAYNIRPHSGALRFKEVRRKVSGKGKVMRSGGSSVNWPFNTPSDTTESLRQRKASITNHHHLISDDGVPAKAWLAEFDHFLDKYVSSAKRHT